MFIATLLTLFACDSAPSTSAVPPADRPTDAGARAALKTPASPAAPQGDWLATVQTRIANDGRAIRAGREPGTFAADLAAVGVRADFDADGVWLRESGPGDAGTDGLHFATVGWGRAGAIETPDWGDPALGDCTEDLDPAGECVPRLEYTDGGVTEWWVGLGTGVEQGWTVDTRPGGSGALQFEVQIDGARGIAANGTVTDASGQRWSITKLVASDANGDAVPVSLKVTDDGVRISVDDAEAVYPIDVDPIWATAAWVGEGVVGVQLGYVVDRAGDVNGDGYDDVILGAYASGRAYIYLGSATGLAATAGTTLSGSAAIDYFGYSVSSAGDMNADGYADVIVGSWFGEYASVYFGSAGGISDGAIATLSGSAGDYFGYSVSGVGDLNGDGFEDVVVGTSSTADVSVFFGEAGGVGATPTVLVPDSLTMSRAAGAVDVNGDGYDDVVVIGHDRGARKYRMDTFEGSATGIGVSAVSEIVGDDSSFGNSGLASAGDVNGDGFGDVIVGADSYTGAIRYQGAAYVYLGSATGLQDSTVTALLGEASNGYFGFAVAGAGDVNGDGYDDVAVGAPWQDSSDGGVSTFLGSATGVSTVSTVILGDTDSALGYAVAGAGDVNGDGYADVIAGSPYYSDGSANGQVSLFTGSTSGLSSTAMSTVDGVSSDIYYGYSVSGAGDVNGDGFGDVIVGTFFYSGFGRAYVYSGSVGGLSSSASTTLTGETESGDFGFSVAGVGDVNADGYGDVLVGEPGAGQAWLFPGSPAGVDGAVFTLLFGGLDGWFGSAVAGGGDVNGDGFDDVVVGDSDRAQADVFMGGATGISSTAATTLSSSRGSYFGCSVAGAGDVNGDSFADLVVGAYGANQALLYFGSSTGVDGSRYAELAGDGTEEQFGTSVAGAGDVSGDGYADVVIGAPGNSRSTGAAYVFLGSAAGPEMAATTTMSGGSPSGIFGRSVAGGGDVNGDGYDDVVVGAYGNSYDGSVGLYPGSSEGTLATPETVLSGAPMYSCFGCSLGGAGDVNGDGYDDVIVGAYGQGAAYLYYGGGPDTDGDGVPVNFDCDDTDASHSAYVTLSPDADTDGYGDPAILTAVCVDAPGYVLDATDCDDTNPAVNPAGQEVCNDLDDDCDGLTDDASAVDQTLWYADSDADGFGDPTIFAAACSLEGHVSNHDDCDDADASVHPDATDIPGDGVDQDCDGSDTPAVADSDTPPGDTGDADEKTGCGCASGSGLGASGLLLPAALLLLRRRRA